MALASFLRESSSERNRPPEPPRIYIKDIPPDAKLTFVDFVPSVTHRDKRDKIYYHPFRILISVANKWLQHNNEWRVINCESVTLLFRHNACSHVSQWDLKPSLAATQVMGQEAAIKALRIWVKRKKIIQNEDEKKIQKDDIQQDVSSQKQEAQTIGYKDFVPAKKDEGKIETLDEVINKINQMIRDGQFHGQIVSVECLQCESSADWTVDPEQTLPGSSINKVTIVRLYYEESSQLFDEEIGLADFIPQHLSGGSLFSRPEFESFASVIDRASHWLSENPEINFRNAQSIDVKLKSMTTIDTRIMTHFEQAGDFIRVLRLAYSKPFHRMQNNNDEVKGLSDQISSHSASTSMFSLPPGYDQVINYQQPIYLSSKMFLLRPKNYSDLKRAINNWYNNIEIEIRDLIANIDYQEFDTPSTSKASSISDWQSLQDHVLQSFNIMSCETVSVFAKNESGFEESFSSNRVGARNRCTFVGIRIYFDIGFHAHKIKQFKDKEEDDRKNQIQSHENDKKILGIKGAKHLLLHMKSIESKKSHDKSQSCCLT